jgi:hypothetical protein
MELLKHGKGLNGIADIHILAVSFKPESQMLKPNVL